VSHSKKSQVFEILKGQGLTYHWGWISLIARNESRQLLGGRWQRAEIALRSECRFQAWRLNKQLKWTLNEAFRWAKSTETHA
jgi:hypothetical protein